MKLTAPASRGRSRPPPTLRRHAEPGHAAGRLRRAIVHGDADPATALDDLLALLMPHTVAEETGLFAELRAEGSLTTAVDQLCAEHDDIHGVLVAVDRAAPDWPTVLAALDRLHRHMDNEEHGLFPAAVIALPIDAWDRITPDHPQDRRAARQPAAAR